MIRGFIVVQQLIKVFLTNFNLNNNEKMSQFRLIFLDALH